MFQQVLTIVLRAHLEIIGPGPFGLAFDLIPTVQDLAHLKRAFLAGEPAGRLVRPGTRVALHLNWRKAHYPEKLGTLTIPKQM